MKKAIILVIIFNILSIYYQFDCSSFSDSLCGGYTPQLTLKCYKDASNICTQIGVDDYCEVNSSYECVKKEGVTLASEEKCFYNDKKTICKKMSKCSDYSDNTCGGLTLSGKQCYKFLNDNFCTEIIVDENCQVKNNLCVKRSGITLQAKEACYFNDDKTSCVKSQKICSKETDCGSLIYDDSENKICSSINGVCKEINIDSTCTVDKSTHICKEKDTIGPKQICAFNSDISECKIRDKVCSDQSTSNCNGFTYEESENKICSLIGNVCKEVSLDSTCTVDGSSNCKEKGTIGPKQICAFNSDISECKIRDKVCSDQSTSNCNGFTYEESENKICSLIEGVCKEVNIDSTCTVDEASHNCQEKNTIDPKKICEFNSDKSTCKVRDKVCQEFTDSKCGGITQTSTSQCFKFSGDTYCSEIELDEFCTVNSSGECVGKEGVNLDYGICVFFYSKRQCKKRDKLCSDMDANNCSTYTPEAKHCFKFEGLTNCKEVKTDGNCEMNSSNKCVVKSGIKMGNNEYCSLDANKDNCSKQVEKSKSNSYISQLNLNLLIICLILFLL